MELSMPVVWSDRCLLHEPAGPREQVVPYVFAHRELGARRSASAVWATSGWFAYDTMTLVGPGTWEAARAAADAALTAGSGAGHRAACILAG